MGSVYANLALAPVSGPGREKVTRPPTIAIRDLLPMVEGSTNSGAQKRSQEDPYAIKYWCAAHTYMGTRGARRALQVDVAPKRDNGNESSYRRGWTQRPTDPAESPAWGKTACGKE